MTAVIWAISIHQGDKKNIGSIWRGRTTHISRHSNNILTETKQKPLPARACGLQTSLTQM